MIISLIAAMDERGGIGKNNRIPWHLSKDLKHFKRVTMGHHLIMGRKTCESIGRPLSGRTVIVLTKDKDFEAPGHLSAHSLTEAFHLAEKRGEKEVFVVGGASVFRQALPLADRLYLTLVHTKVKADTYFPDFNLGSWKLESETHYEANSENQYSFTIRYFVRN